MLSFLLLLSNPTWRPSQVAGLLTTLLLVQHRAAIVLASKVEPMNMSVAFRFMCKTWIANRTSAHISIDLTHIDLTYVTIPPRSVRPLFGSDAQLLRLKEACAEVASALLAFPAAGPLKAQIKSILLMCLPL